MRVDSQKNIVCDSEGSIATINHLAAENIFGEKLSVEDVISILAANRIICHIDTMAIEMAVEESNQTGDPIENLEVARARTKNEITFADSVNIEPLELMQAIDSCRKAYHSYKHIDEDLEQEFQARFIAEDSLICQIRYADQENVYGEKIRKQHIPVNLKAGENVTLTETDHAIVFHAEKTGYLIIDDDMKMHIVSPFQFSSDRMKLFFTIMPLRTVEEYKALLNFFAIENQSLTPPDLSCIDIYAVLERIKLVKIEKNIVEHLIVAQGINPIPGQDSTIEILADTERQKHQGNEMSISDYMKMAHYTMVNKDDLLAKITPAIEGVPGKDVYGNTIYSQDGISRDVKIGDNIRTEIVDEVIHLYADTDGCLVYNNYNISVSDALHINGDVGPDTGNIVQGASVIINGNILSGFSVECKKDLIVKGCIENGAMVKCGSLVVSKGIFCKKGFIFVKQNADICYIQDANIRVAGDLTVQRYIHGSNITVRGNLTVLGRGVTGKQRGAVMGSKISVLGSAAIHSVGCISEDTFVACGVDHEMSIQIENSETVISNLQSEVAAKQKNLYIDLNNENTVDILASLPKEKKDEIAQGLKEIKKLLNTIDTYKEKIEALKEKAYAADLDTISIVINNFIIPKTTVEIGSHYHTITQKHNGTKIKYMDKEIKLFSNY